MCAVTTLARVTMSCDTFKRAANQSVRDGLHSYDRRHGWRGGLPNILRDNLGQLDSYEDEDWRHAIDKGSYVTGLVMAVGDKDATVKIGANATMDIESSAPMTIKGAIVSIN